jgi:hypothetical protein
MVMLTRSIRSLVLALFVVAGCGPVLFIGSPEWFAQHSYGRAALARKAAFDLGCTEEQLSFTCLGANEQCDSVGVTGCAQRATYVFVQDEWVMNTSTTSGGDGAP